MASFSHFLATFDPDPGKRGRQFEHFVKWFLQNDPEWATQVEEVWLWNAYPQQWGRDCGIDLVFKDKIGGIWAVQAKCYSPNYEITKPDVDKFLSESNRKEINHRLLIATTDRIGPNARQVLDGQEKSVVRYHLMHFEGAAVEYPDSIERLSVGKRKPPPELDRPYQLEAIDNVISGFRTADRGQLVMACGTGKTFVCLWVKERLKAKRTLVLVPSLGLLSQTLNEWTGAAREQFNALCVCSDQTVNRREEDEAISLVSDIPFPVSSDVREIARFLEQDKDQVIFSTYQSSPLIAQVQKHDSAPFFDLVIADEAHWCASKSDSPFRIVLDSRLIKSDRRLFATATPRVYKTSLKKAAEKFGVEVVDMNDEKAFGKRFHTLTFGESIKRGLLTDYRVLIVGVDNERIREWIESRRLVATDTGLATDARSLAEQIGLLKAIKDWNLRRVISFHGRVKRAKEFSEDIMQVGEWLDENHRPSGTLWAEYVSGEMPTITRKRKLKRLKNLGKGEIGLLSNSRCLSEGVDVPALDGVAFVDPRRSEIDIIQSVGRAIRLSDNKTMGTIVIPVFIGQTENVEEALEASDFKPIWDVLEALKSHDNRLSDELDQLRIELGAKRKRSVGAGDLAKIVFDLPTSVNENFAQSLRAHLVTKTTESWMFWYGLLQTFVKDHGHCRVPALHTEDGFALGRWVDQQRQLKLKGRLRLSAARRQRLDDIGFDWNPHDTYWEMGFSYLQRYFQGEHHCLVPQEHKEDGYALGDWVSHQRAIKLKLSLEHRQRLDALGFVWDAREAAWEEGYRHLLTYVEQTRDCRVPRNHYENGFPLGEWVSVQRLQKDTLSVERRQKLDDLDFIWDTRETAWDKGYNRLKLFKEREGHCRVPVDYKDSDGFNLGQWVINQRARKDRLSENRRNKLNHIAFVWKPFEEDWEIGFDLLQRFEKDEGHCDVPQAYKTKNGVSLGQWVSLQRLSRSKLSKDRVRRLNKLGFVWDSREFKWDDGYERLKRYKQQKGDCRIPMNYKDSDGFRLGGWVLKQRQNRKKLSQDRLKKLEKLGFDWNPLETDWQEGLHHLKSFKQWEGHCLVPVAHYEDGYPLGRWVNRQRTGKDRMSPDRRRQLDKLGFAWKAR
jgi:superfamily II DNA or RNA helicase